MNIEQGIAQKLANPRPREDSTKRMGNVSLDMQMQADLIIHKSPVTGALFLPR